MNFENPKSISSNQEKADKILLTFFDADKYLVPKDKSLKSILNGFKLEVEAPLQMSQEIAEVLETVE